VKKKFSRILGVGLTIALLTSLILTASPVGANVTTATVTVGNDDISASTTYDIVFKVNTDLTTAGTITVVFPSDTDASGCDADTNVTVQSSAGIWSGTLNVETDVTAANITVVDDQTITFTLGALASSILEGANVRIKFKNNCVENPSAIGDDYTLTVATSTETTAVTSEAYEMEAPTISPLPGIVTGRNSANVILYQETGDDAIANAITTTGVVTIEVGPGTYDDDITCSVADQVITSTDGALVTIIAADATTGTVGITAAATFDGFTVEGTVTVGAADAIVTDCVFQAAIGAILNAAADIDDCTFEVEDTEVGADVTAVDGTITGCVFDVEDTGTGVDIGANTTIENSMFNGASGTGIDFTATATATIEGNTFDGLDTAIVASAGTPTLDISGNAISNCAAEAINVDVAAVLVTIIGNTISDNEDDILLVDVTADAEVIFLTFNSITGNTKSVDNNDTTNTVDATNNWWGSVTGPEVDSEGLVDDDPWLFADVSNGIVVTGAASLDAKSTAGVIVSSNATATNEPVSIAAATYAGNPGTAAVPGVASDYFDVYVNNTGGDATSFSIMLYGGVGSDTKAYVWGAGLGEWVECDTQAVNVYAGAVTVTVTATTIPTLTDLSGLPFALSTPAAVMTLPTPTILAPDTGSDDVSLTPTLVWSAVTGADGYYLQLADNANFVLPMAKLDGDLARLIVTAYTYITELPYSTPYYWRVKAVSGTVAASNLKESSWATSVFLTKAEPEEVLPPIVVETQPAAPAPIIEPIVEVITPAAEMITPAWIYIIIGVGGLLVIAVVVLIVRTRRVA